MQYRFLFSSPLLLALLLASVVAPADELYSERISERAGDGSVMLRSPDGDDLVRLRPERALAPASLLKIPLAQVALDVLGEDFRFETRFYRNAANDLLIRGLGDPFLVSEEVEQIARDLARAGVGPIRRLIVDDSAFAPDPDLPLEAGTRQPYGARNSALAVNFNTVNLAWSAGGQLISGEPQTPLTPLARELGAALNPGQPQRINLGADPRNGLRQVQQVFRIFLGRAGVAVRNDGFFRQALSDEWRLVHQHHSSRTLRDNLDSLLRYSNNFIANQLFLTIGAQQHGYPATAAAARTVLQQWLADHYGGDFGSDPGSLYMIEGSGLAREQRASALAMMRILEDFRPHARLLPEEGGVLRKSGTLTGVYNFAGYIPGPDGLYPFVILTHQAGNRRDALLRELRDRVTRRPP